MAKFTLNCEFDSLQELREFIVGNDLDVEMNVGESEQPKRRRRRTKTEIEAESKQSESEVVDVKPEVVLANEVETVPLEEVKVVPPHEIELIPRTAQSPFLAGVIPTTQAGTIQFAAPAVESEPSDAANVLPADLLGALSGLGTK